MELEPRLKQLCLLLLDVERVPVLSRAIRVAIVAYLHAQAKMIMEHDIPVLTEVIELGPEYQYLRESIKKNEQQRESHARDSAGEHPNS